MLFEYSVVGNILNICPGIWYKTETTVVVSDTETTDLYCEDSFSGMKPALFVWFHKAWLAHVYNIRAEGIPSNCNILIALILFVCSFHIMGSNRWCIH